MSPNLKISLPILIYENNFFILYNVPLFSIKLEFCINFMALIFANSANNTAIIRTLNV